MKRCVCLLALLWVEALAACDADFGPTVTVTDSAGVRITVSPDTPTVFGVVDPQPMLDQAAQRLVQAGNLEEAVSAFERSSDLYPGSARAFNHLGDVYRMTCQWDESKANYSKAYAMAQEMAFSNVDNCRMELDRITTQIESGSECTPPGARTEVDVPEHVLETYVGAYELAPGMTIVVTLEDGALFAQLRGQQKAGLFAESETEFFLKIVDAQVTFTKDGGAVTGMILHQNGRAQPAPKVRRPGWRW
jgi:tetratricopeptide (TPR) repeat protein